MKPTIVIHGGAGAWARMDGKEQAVTEAMHRATSVGWEILAAGGSALDAVEKAVNVLEDDPLFDAGTGSYLNKMGEIEMDALIVDGDSLDFGAVAAVHHVRYPITLARLVMTKAEPRFVVGTGADWLALELGLPAIPNLSLVTPEALQTFHNQNGHISLGMDTVGAVAIDAQGRIASATSTGGTADKWPGRVGDSPLFGAGGYADSRFGGASATGKGENIMRVLLSKYAVDQLASGMSAQEAAVAASHYIAERFDDPNSGIIVIDSAGRVGMSHTTNFMPTGWVDEQGALRTSLGVGVEGLK